MMIIGIGVDLVEVSRIEKALQQEGFKEKIFTDEEIAYCESKKCHAAESFSGRYAVKEAVGKALGTGILPGQFEKSRPCLMPRGCLRSIFWARSSLRP